MNKIDLSPLIECDCTHNRICEELFKKLNTGWDDAVKESFLRFISQIESNGEELHNVRTSAELIEKAIAEFDVNQICRNADLLVEEVSLI